MPHLPLAEGDLYYEDQGQGPALVMLRGLGRSLRYWHGFDQLLSKHFRVITMDMRGIGRTTVPSGSRQTAFDLASDVAALMDHLDLEQAHVLGVSLGGMVALALGLRYPERCQSLIVINTSVAGLKAPRLSQRAVGAMLLGPMGGRGRIHQMLASALTGRSYGREKQKALASRYAAIAAEEGIPAKTVLRQLIAALRFRVVSDLQNLQVPTLVLYGTDDRFVPPVNSRRLFQILPQAQLLAVEGGGHEVTIDHPEEVKRAVLAWTGLSSTDFARQS